MWVRRCSIVSGRPSGVVGAILSGASRPSSSDGGILTPSGTNAKCCGRAMIFLSVSTMRS